MTIQKRFLFSWLTAGALVGALVVFALAAREVSADGPGSPAACLDASNVSSAPAGDADIVVGGVAGPTYNAGAGNTVEYVCLSTGATHSGPLTANAQYTQSFVAPNGDTACYEVSGIDSQSVTVTRVDDGCATIAHLDVGVQLGERTVQIVKVTTGDGPTQNFGGTISGHSPTAWIASGAPGGGAPTVIVGVSTLGHTVIEDPPPAGWTFAGYQVLTGQQTCSAAANYSGAGTRTAGAVIPADANNYTVCVRNTYNPSRTVRIIKVTSGGGLPQTFSGTISDHAPGTWFVAGGVTPFGGAPADITGVSPATHVVVEAVPPAGWSFVGYSVLEGLQANCAGAGTYTGLRASGAVIPANSGNYTVCIRDAYTETRTVRIIKTTDGGGLPQSFSGTISDHPFGFWSVAGGVAPLGGTATDITDVSFGSHLIVESTPPVGWEFGGYYVLNGLQANCLGAGAYGGTRSVGVVIPADANNYTVCVRNLYQPGRTVRIIKVTSGGGLPQNFSGTISDHAPGTWVATGGVAPGGGTPSDIVGISFGSHTVIESGPPAGWEFGGYYILGGLQANCLGAGTYAGLRVSGAVIPADGNNYTVCVRNTYTGSRTVRIIKVTSGGGLPQTFGGTISDHSQGTWAVAGGFAPNGGVPTDIAGVSGGVHVVVEGSLPAGWGFAGYSLLSGLQANCSNAGTYTGSSAVGVTIPGDGNSYTVCISNVYLATTPTATPTATPTPTVTPPPATPPPGTVAPGPPSTGAGLTSGAGSSAAPLWILAAIIMLASTTLAFATGGGRATGPRLARVAVHPAATMRSTLVAPPPMPRPGREAPIVAGPAEPIVVEPVEATVAPALEVRPAAAADEVASPATEPEAGRRIGLGAAAIGVASVVIATASLVLARALRARGRQGR